MTSLSKLFKFFLAIFLVGSLALPVQAARSVPATAVDRQNTDKAIKLFQEGKQVQAVRQLMQQAYQGNVAAQFNLGIINFGRTDEGIAPKEARFWFERAAKEGDVGAQYNLALLLLGDTDNSPVNLAAHWLERSAEGGHIKAQTNLGILTLWSPEFPLTEAAGVKWLETAVKNQDPLAAEALELWHSKASSEAVLPNLYPMDLNFRSDVVRGGSRVKRTDSLVYALPTSRQKPLLQLPEGYKVEIVNKTNGWIKVKLAAGLPAWILAGHADISGGRAVISKLETRLYVEPEIGPEIYKLGTVSKGESLRIMESERDWIRVESPLRFSGWMRETDVDILVRSSISELAMAAELSNGQNGAGTGDRQLNVTLRKLPPNPEDPDQKSITASSRSLLGTTEVFKNHNRDSAVLGVLQRGDIVEMGSSQNGFTQISSNSISAWIYAGLVSGGAESGSVNRDGARVRSRPNTSSPIVGLYQKGRQLTLLEKQGDWYRIERELDAGWVHSSILGQISSQGSESANDSIGVTDDVGQNDSNVTQEEESLPEPESISGEPVAVVNTRQTATGAPEVSATDEIKVPVDTIIYVNGSVSSRPLGRILQTSSAQIRQRSNEMTGISFQGSVYGWIYASLVTPEGDEGVVSKDQVRVRLDPDTSVNNVIAVRNAGDRVRLIDKSNGWYRIELEAEQGWVSTVLLSQ